MNKNSLFLPLSIVIAAIVIGGAIIYEPGERADGLAAAIDTLKPFDYSALAAEIGLDGAKFDACFASDAYNDEILKDREAAVVAGVTGTPTTYINGREIVGAVSYNAYKAAIDEALKDPKDRENNKGPGIDDDHVLGNEEALVDVVIFGDYQCPFCERAYRTSENDLRKEYVDTGKVRVVFRDFPLDFHPAAIPAARAAQCAGEQGMYWEYHDALFENQERL